MRRKCRSSLARAERFEQARKTSGFDFSHDLPQRIAQKTEQGLAIDEKRLSGLITAHAVHQDDRLPATYCEQALNGGAIEDGRRAPLDLFFNPGDAVDPPRLVRHFLKGKTPLARVTQCCWLRTLVQQTNKE